MRALTLSAFALLALFIAGKAQAQAPDPAPAPANGRLNSLYACTEIGEASARLACFDAATANLRTAENVGEVRVIDLNSVQELDRESFGFSLPSLAKILAPKKSAVALGAAPLDRIQAIIQSVRIAPSGAAVITLDNGQIWRQIDQERPFALKPGKSVQVSKASLGSFFLVVGSSQAFRVRREQ